MAISQRAKAAAAIQAAKNRAYFLNLSKTQEAPAVAPAPIPAAAMSVSASSPRVHAAPVPRLQALCKSTKLRPIGLPLSAVPDGYWPCNPSVVAHKGELLCTVRCVNYRLPGSTPSPHTVNLFLRLTSSLAVRRVKTISNDDFAPRSGYEDMRLFSLGNRLGASATVLNGRRVEMALVELTDDFDVARAYVQVTETPGRAEKNWMPVILPNGKLRWIYSVDPTVVRAPGETKPVSESLPCRPLGDLHGSSQLVEVLGGYLAVVHETIILQARRVYVHMFVAFDRNLKVAGISSPFYFRRIGVEFCAGMARHPRHPDRLVLSFGVHDEEAWLAEVDEFDIACLMRGVDGNGRSHAANAGGAARGNGAVKT
jgi:hypothetical protein